MVDLGTGDGRAVVDRARRDPAAFVVGIDASASAMAEASARAARPIGKGGLPNALFVVAAAERPPAELIGTADELTIRFPWGSLLRGALALDEEAANGIAALLAPTGRVEMLISVAAQDEGRLAIPPITVADRADLDARWHRHGLCVAAFRAATAADVRTSGSTWSRRLLAGRAAPEREVWRLVLRREPPPGPGRSRR